jgi:hypothetical protein
MKRVAGKERVFVIPNGADAVGDVAEIIGQTQGCSICRHDPDDLATGIERALQHSGPTTGRMDISHLERSVVAERVIAVYESVLKKRNVAGQELRTADPLWSPTAPTREDVYDEEV